MPPRTTEQKLFFILRLAVAMCFIGHGAFGIITKPIWCNYFAVFGIGKSTAYQLMPVVGGFDIAAGILVLIHPLRIIPAWLVIWGIITASLRPLSGEPFAELIERAGNFGAPLTLLLLSGPGGLYAKLTPPAEMTPETRQKLNTSLRIIVFLLLLGHGWLNVIGKKGLLDQYTALGFPAPASAALYIGCFEILAACAALIKPIRSFLLICFVWKITSELFYPHWELFEFIERGGSYGCILALWLLTAKTKETPAFLPLAS